MTPRELLARTAPPSGGWLALAALALPGGSPLRGAAVVLFLAAGPGAALVRVCAPALAAHPAEGPAAGREATFARRSDLLERLMLALFVSVAAVMLVATVLIATHTFSAQRVLLTLTLLTTIAAFCPPLRASPRARTTPTTPEGSAQ
ncbi:hypothetical protein [Streptomyces sp. NPDC004830]